MKNILLILLLTPVLALAYYGKDNRKELYEVTSPEVKKIARAMAYQVERHYELRGWTFNRLWELVMSPYQNQKICPEERYVKQLALRKNCTGILVGKKHLLTAGNCLTEHYCKNDLYYWMFDYNLKQENQFNIKRPRKNFYKCHKVLKRVFNPNTEKSYALIELKKEVRGIEPIKINTKNDMSLDDELLVLGHMRGLPLKVDNGARVIDQSNNNYIINSDLPGRMTRGAGVFNPRTLKLEGILVHGSAGYSKTAEGCLKEDMHFNEDAGEFVFKTHLLKDLLKNL